MALCCVGRSTYGLSRIANSSWWTTRPISVRKPIDPRRVHSYALQLQLYAIALEQIAGRPVTRAYLHFLRPGRLDRR